MKLFRYLDADQVLSGLPKITDVSVGNSLWIKWQLNVNVDIYCLRNRFMLVFIISLDIYP